MSLQDLRNDPEAACARNAYITNVRRSGNETGTIASGGSCSVEFADYAEGVFTLTAIPQPGEDALRANDYCYPYRGGGIGWVRVPSSVPNGSLVLSDGLSGCSIVVSKSADAYYFYHDADSKTLDKHPGFITGDVVAKIAPQDYDPQGELNAMMAQFSGHATFRQSPINGGCFVIAVKTNGRFGLYVSKYLVAGGKTSVFGHAGPRCLATLP